MKIAISGATGFVGKHISSVFNHTQIIKIGRKELSLSDTELATLLDGVDIVINLAGAPIINRWSEEYKKELYHSRIDTTKKLVLAMQNATNKPKLFISTSAVGVYDNGGVYSEDNTNYSNDTLGKICQDWENEALKVQDNIRTVIFRFGIILGKDGGAITKMILPFKLGLGGILGSGKQAFSWVHISDLERAFKYVVENESCSGVYNLTAPNPTTNYEFTKTFGKVLRRPTIFPVPAFVLNIIFGEGSCVLLDGQSVIPKRLLDSGFVFRFDTIERALVEVAN